MSDARAGTRAQDARRILTAAIAAADPAPAVRSAVTSLHGIVDAHRVHVLALGKAAAPMAAAARDALPRPAADTLIIVPHGTAVEASADAHVIHAAHPEPDASSVRAAASAAALLSNAAAGDVVIVLISGGASSLCAAPAADITIEDYAALVRALQHAGADIVELNTVRRHIDTLKGGGMARLAPRARTIGLIVSDVPGNPLHIIASGPLSPGLTTPHDARAVLERYDLWSACPASMRRVLTAPDAPKQPDARTQVSVHIIADNGTALTGAAHAAAQLGYDVRIADAPVTGSAREAGARTAHAAMRMAQDLRAGGAPVCLLSGGETTVAVTGAGTGGRNQELALAAALELAEIPGITIASIGTDGVDGPSDAAGAIADGSSVASGAHAGADAALALEHNDSHSFFTAAGGLIRTGPTGTNVMDVQVALIDPPGLRDLRDPRGRFRHAREKGDRGNVGDVEITAADV